MNQREEIETIRERNISLNLSDADVKRICEKAGNVGLTVPELLQNFIGDLVNGTYSNGSDERLFAERWFDRCWFSMFPNDIFLQYLIDLDMVEEIIDYWNDMKTCEPTIEDIEDDKEIYEEAKERIDEIFSEFIDQIPKGHETPKLKEEMAKVIKWWNEYQQLK